MKVKMPEEAEMTESKDLPTAVARPVPRGVWALSQFWWLTLAALVVAIVLTLWAMPVRGTPIAISFPQGHGLQVEDPIRYRGIDVGVVERVQLNGAMDRVKVVANLFPEADRLAVEGSRFWIVRPQIGITGVTGLETAVGHKYIEVLPGEPDSQRAQTFDGLTSSPVESRGGNGMEILLRSDRRYSVSAGSSIHYRGVDIGRILSIGLSSDSRHVEIRASIDEAHKSLVTTESRFWATGGLDVDFSLTKGLKLDTESLDTLARGGVSMLVVDSGEPVDAGHVFSLAAKADEQWTQAANNFRMTTAQLRGSVRLEANWKEKLLFRQWKQSQRFSGIGWIAESGQPMVVLPADILARKSDAVPESFSITMLDGNGSRAVIEPDQAESLGWPVVSVAVERTDGEEWFSQQQLSASFEPAAMIAVRRSYETGSFLHLPIAKESMAIVYPDESNLETSDGRLAATEPISMSLIDFEADRDVWHGCPVLSAADSSLVGMLLIDRQGPRIQRMVGLP